MAKGNVITTEIHKSRNKANWPVEKRAEDTKRQFTK